MTPYQKLQAHLERHVYKRGAFKGDAPADKHRRSMNHFRVVKDRDNMAVQMYNTYLIDVTPNNDIRISTGGWFTSTTKQNLNSAMAEFLGWGCVFSHNVFGLSQPCIRVVGKTYRFYDGMEFTAQGELLSPARCFQRRRTDRDATAEFRKDIEESGFKAVWPVLFATAEPNRRAFVAQLTQTVTAEYHSSRWADVAAYYKAYHPDHKEAYRAIVSACTSGMKEIVDTDVTVI